MKSSSAKKQPKSSFPKAQRYFTPQVKKDVKNHPASNKTDKFNATMTGLEDVADKSLFERKKFNTPIKKTTQTKKKAGNTDEEMEVIKMKEEKLSNADDSDDSDDSDYVGEDSDDEDVSSADDVEFSNDGSEDNEDDPSDGSVDFEEELGGDSSKKAAKLAARSPKLVASPKAQLAKLINSPVVKKALKRKRAASSDEDENADEDNEHSEGSLNQSYLVPPPDKRKRVGDFVADSKTSTDTSGASVLASEPKSPIAKQPKKKATEKQVKNKVEVKTKGKNKLKPKREIKTVLPENKEPKKMPTDSELIKEIHRREVDKDNRTVILKKLPKKCNEKILRDFCRRAVTLRVNASKRMAYVICASKTDALATIATTKSRKLKGKYVAAVLCSEWLAKSSVSRPREARPLKSYLTTTLHISCIPTGVDQLEMGKIFPEAIKINCANYEGEKSEGMATVVFAQDSQAVNAFYLRDGTVINDVPIIVNFKIKAQSMKKGPEKAVEKKEPTIKVNKNSVPQLNKIKVKKEKTVQPEKKRK